MFLKIFFVHVFELYLQNKMLQIKLIYIKCLKLMISAQNGGIPISQVTSCPGFRDERMTCKELATNTRYYVGHRTLCTCLESCQDVVMECNSTGYFYHNGNNDIRDICNS
jgi:hypothetical protein